MASSALNAAGKTRSRTLDTGAHLASATVNWVLTESGGGVPWRCAFEDVTVRVSRIASEEGMSSPSLIKRTIAVLLMGVSAHIVLPSEAEASAMRGLLLCTTNCNHAFQTWNCGPGSTCTIKPCTGESGATYDYEVDCDLAT